MNARLIGAVAWVIFHQALFISLPVMAAVAPIITNQPQSQTVALGASATLVVQATGSVPFRYGWFLNGNQLPGPGATNGSFTITNFTANDAGFYTATVSNDAGTATSSPALLNLPGTGGPPNDLFVDRLPLSGPHPSATFSTFGATKEPGEPDHLGIPGGKSIWWKWTAPSSGGAAFTTTNSFPAFVAVYTGNSITNLTAVPSNTSRFLDRSIASFSTRAGTEYEIVVDGVNGAEGTGMLSLDLLLESPIQVQPTGTFLGTNVTLSVTASSASEPLTYEWRLEQVAIPGATNSSLTLAPLKLSDGGSYQVIVRNGFSEIGSDPVTVQVLVRANLVPGPDQTAVYGSAFTFSPQFDQPVDPKAIRFSLDPGSPSGAAIDPVTGVVTWTPDPKVSPVTNTINIRAVLYGMTNLTTTGSFRVVVADAFEIRVGQTAIPNGQTGTLSLDVQPDNLPGRGVTNLSFVLEYPPALLTNLNITTVSSNATQASISPVDDSHAQVTIQSKPGEMFNRTEQLALITFTARPSIQSGAGPVTVQQIQALENDGSLAFPITSPGRVVVAGQIPLLEARLLDGGQRNLVVYGQAGATYQIESRTNLVGNDSWQPGGSITLSNFFGTVPGINLTNKMIFFRGRVGP